MSPISRQAAAVRISANVTRSSRCSISSDVRSLFADRRQSRAITAPNDRIGTIPSSPKTNGSEAPLELATLLHLYDILKQSTIVVRIVYGRLHAQSNSCTGYP